MVVVVVMMLLMLKEELALAGATLSIMVLPKGALVSDRVPPDRSHKPENPDQIVECRTSPAS